MTRARKKLARVCALALPLVGFALPASAQDEGPIVFGQQEKRPFFQFTNIQASAELLYRRQSSTIDPKDQPKQDFLENRFEETFTLDTYAYLYHPNLVNLHLAGTFGLRQDTIDNNGESDNQNGFINDYNVSATILQKEIAPLTLYSFRTEDVVNRTFGPSLDHTLMQTGAIWDIRSKNFPTRIEVYHSDEEESGFGDVAQGFGDFTLVQDTALIHSEAHPRPDHTFTLDSTASHVNQQTAGQPTQEYNTIDATLTYSIDFGPQKKSNFYSTLQFFNQDGDFALERIHWNELLRLHHNENLETRYSYTLDSQSYLGTDQLTNRAVASLTHRLFKSLVTTADVGAQKLDLSGGGGNDEFFADIHWDYTKQVPLGRITAFLGGAYDYQDNLATTSPTTVINAPFTFNDPMPVVIIGRNIVPNSVVVTNTRGNFLYAPGVDYTLNSAPQRLEVNRIPDGRIDNGQTVSIDYTLAPQGANTVDTRLFNFGARYDFDQSFLRNLGVYGRYAKQDQNISSSDQSFVFVPNSFTDIVYGADYRIGGLTIGVERETHDSTIYPFDSDRIYGHYVKRASADTTYSANASYSKVDYPDTGDEVDFLSVAGQVQHNFTRELSGYFSLLYQDENDKQNGDTRGFEEQIELRWYHRQTSVYFVFRNSDFTTEQQDNSFQFLEVGIRREF